MCVQTWKTYRAVTATSPAAIRRFTGTAWKIVTTVCLVSKASASRCETCRAASLGKSAAKMVCCITTDTMTKPYVLMTLTAWTTSACRNNSCHAEVRTSRAATETTTSTLCGSVAGGWCALKTRVWPKKICHVAKQAKTAAKPTCCTTITSTFQTEGALIGCTAWTTSAQNRGTYLAVKSGRAAAKLTSYQATAATRALTVSVWMTRV